MKRYEALAEEIAQSIRTGVMKLGDRLPSVRQAGASRAVSASTVFQAYYLLEARGLIRARERSGYYVIASARPILPEVDNASRPTAESTQVDVSDLVFDILESTKNRDVVPFGSAFPSPLLFPFPRLARSMAASIQKMDPWSTVDDLTPGDPALRRQIALRYLADGMHVHTDDIVITNGALEALNLCLHTVARPQRQRHQKRHKPRACWLMTNFQNPLGCLMLDEKKQALVALLAAHQVPLIEDDVYVELYFGRARPLPAKAFDKAGLVMHCSSFSKCLAPGYRVGWAAPGKFAGAVARLKLARTLSASAPAQGAIADYLAKGGYDRHLRQLRHALSVQQDAMLQAVARYFPRGTKATRPPGGYFLWVELPGQVDVLQIQRSALSLGISVAPGPMFSAERKFLNCIRLNYGHPWDERTEAAMATLGRIIAANSATVG